MTTQQSDQQQLVDKPRRKRKRLLWLILPAALVLTAGIVVALWQFGNSRVDPAYTAAIDRVVREHTNTDLYLPTWMIDGFLPQSYEIDTNSVDIRFCLDNDPDSYIFFSAFPGAGVTYDQDVDRAYTVHNKGIEYIYQEKRTSASVQQAVLWYKGTFSISYLASSDKTKLREEDLLHIARSVKKFPQQTEATAGEGGQ